MSFCRRARRPCWMWDAGPAPSPVMLFEAGHSLIGLDLAEGMLRVAKRKAAAHGVAIAYLIADAADPPLGGVVDVVLARHVLWALPDPAEVLARWASLLRPGGRLVLVEGRWATGAGLTAKELEALVRPVSSRIVLRRLDDPSLWGKSITDERYLLMAYGRDP